MCAVLRAHHEYRSHTSRRDLTKFLIQSHTNYRCLKQLKEQFELVTQAMERILTEYAQTQHKLWCQVPQKKTSSDNASVSCKKRQCGSTSRRQDGSTGTSLDKDKDLCGEPVVLKNKDSSRTVEFTPQVPCY